MPGEGESIEQVLKKHNVTAMSPDEVKGMMLDIGRDVQVDQAFLDEETPDRPKETSDSGASVESPVKAAVKEEEKTVESVQ